MTSPTVLYVVLLLQLIHHGVSAINPSFATDSQDLSVFEGETVEIKCTVRNIPDYSRVFWQNGSQILSSSRTVFISGQRITIEGQGDVYNLKIRDVREWDDGQYTCQIPSGQPITQTNRITVKKPPSIVSIYPGVIVRVQERERLQLECRATGRPRPKVTWSRQDRGMLPSGRLTEDGDLLTVSSVRRNTSGAFICTASNGVGSPANASISVIVEYSPVVNVSVDTIHTGPAQSVSIECTIQAEPEAEIFWYHNNSAVTVDTSRRKNIRKGKQKISESTFRHMLEITNLLARDLGMYKCEGRNEIGFGSKVITLSAYPFNVTIVSDSQSDYRQQYTIQWKVYSYSPLTEFMLSLKQINETWDTPWIQFNIPATASAQYQQQQQHSTHIQEYRLRDLVPNSAYLATIQARNAYGDSEMSDEFRFHTAAVDITTTTLATTTTKATTTTTKTPPFKRKQLFDYSVGMGTISALLQTSTLVLTFLLLTVINYFQGLP